MISVILKASVSIAIAFVVAVLLANNSGLLHADIAAPFANISASLFDRFGSGATNTNQAASLVQSAGDVETWTVVDKQPPSPDRTTAVAAVEPVVEKVESQSDVLFRQFQAWAAAQADVTPAQPDQDVKVVQSAPAKLAAPQPGVQKRQTRPVLVKNAPAKMSARSPRKPPQPVQNAQVQVPPSLMAERQWTLRSE
jgi:hypothetical protein